MENKELYSFGDMPVSELMHAITSSVDVDFDDETDEDIEHSGIKGMKWGVRRFQNRDGSLTPAGKKRYNQELSKVRAAEKVVKTKQATKAKIDKLNDRKKAVEDAEAELKSVSARTKSSPKKGASTDVEVASKKKTVKDMSEDELNTAIKRMQLEKQFNTLQSELNPKKESMGRDFVKKLTRNALDGTAEAGKNVAKTFMEKKLKELLGVDDKVVEKVKTEYEKRKDKYDMDKLEYDIDKLKLDRKLLNRDYKDVAEALNSLSKEERDNLEDAVNIKNKIDRLLTVGEKKK